MTNEAVILELGPNGGKPIRYSCIDTTGIAKGELCCFQDPYYISGALNLLKAQAFAGIAAAEKVASDGSTSIALYTDGIFDLTTAITCGAEGVIRAGSIVVMSGANQIINGSAAHLLSGAVVGKALEEAAMAGTAEVIRVKVGSIV